ncbi:ATP-dependent helicase [Leptospira yanagawae]|uniref:DNA 3'-5' helicase n=1 Tax=Leptospira yanagawae TaxID=293069 RepID=A0ABY2LZY3_9LEPT|nr:ATP-dependent helicase [Leptospira yanagawae]TGL18777.1 ATP-dependent helicase [Leptospira yanagawae]
MTVDLNEAQKEVVLTKDGPILVVAGAGTGKTNTLVHKLAHLVKTGTNPESILLLTFTRRAAKEMLGRASGILDQRMMSVKGGTFHSFCQLFLRRYGNSVSILPNFSILDEEDTIGFVGMARDQVVTPNTKLRFPKKETLAEMFSSSFNLQISLEKFIQKEYPMFIGQTKEIQEIKNKFNELKRKHNALDFDDLLDVTRSILMSDEVIREKMASIYQYILVDEYQDTNRIQAHIACLLASKHQNILVVGDDAQCIYGFRGANVRNMLDFPKIFPKTKIIQLTENYRSVQPILDVANSVLAGSKENYKKNLFSIKTKSLEKPFLVKLENLEEEAEWISSLFLELYENGNSFSEMAALFRAGYSSHLLEMQLTAKRIPYRKYGGKRFLDLAHVKDTIAYLKVIENPNDILSWNRILLLEDHIGKKYANLIYKQLETNSFDWETDPQFFLGIPESTKLSFLKLLECLEICRFGQKTPSQILEQILAHYLPILTSNYDDAEKRKPDLEALVYLAKKETNVTEYLSQLVLNPVEGKEIGSDEDSENEFVTLSTIHSAKGLEWKFVVNMQIVEGVLPNHRIKTVEELEEERRLFYVAITRAKNSLYLTNPLTNEKNRYTSVSRFISDLPNEGELFTKLSPIQNQNITKEGNEREKDGGTDPFQSIQNYFLN